MKQRGLLILLLLLPKMGYSANALISQEYTVIDQEQYAVPLAEVLDMPAVRERLFADIDFTDLRWEPFEHLTAYKVPDTLMVVYAPVAEVGTYFIIRPTERTVIGTLRGNRLYGWFNPAAFQFWTTFALGGGSDLEGYAFYRWDGMTSVQHQYTILVEETSTQIPSEPNIDATVVTRQDGCLLRTTPEMIQAPNIGSEEHLMCRTSGNIVAEFPKGSNGQALYEMRSKDGKLWYFVIMALHERAQSCYLYPGLKADSFAGWMNGECVQLQRTSAAGGERAANILRVNTQFELCLRPILCCRQRRR